MMTDEELYEKAEVCYANAQEILMEMRKFVGTPEQTELRLRVVDRFMNLAQLWLFTFLGEEEVLDDGP